MSIVCELISHSIVFTQRPNETVQLDIKFDVLIRKCHSLTYSQERENIRDVARLGVFQRFAIVCRVVEMNSVMVSSRRHYIILAE